MDATRIPILERYAEAARRVDAGDACDGCASGDGPFGAGNYDDLAGLPDAAVQVSLGCGNPVAVADLHPGETVLDLGSGGGIDVLLSARRVGPTGFAYGLDATVEMLELARRNAAEAGASNVEFLHGTIEQIPLDGRIGRRRHLELRHRAVGRQGRHVRRDRPRAAPRRPGRDQRHRPRRPRRRHTDHRLLRRRRHHTRRPTRTRCATPGSATSTIDADRRDRRRAVQRHHPRRASRPSRSVRCATRTGRRCATSTRPGSPPATPRSRPRRRRWERWDASHLADHRLVATDDDVVVGWAALSPVSDRCVYAGVAENSVYIHPDHRGRGVGTDLLDALVPGAERAGYWTVQTGIFPENTASIAAHERVGFRIVGRRERIGQLDGVWRDTLFLERRSTRI